MEGIVPVRGPTDPLAELYATVKRDSQGRLWVPAFVDGVELAAVETEQRKQVEAMYAAKGADVSVEDFDGPDWEPDPLAGEWAVSEREAWDNPCGGGTGVHIWDAESRVQVSGEMTHRQSASMFIVVDKSTEEFLSTCSGADVESKYNTVTAAHCLDDAVAVWVCKYGNDTEYWAAGYEYYSTNFQASVCVEASSWLQHPNYQQFGTDIGDDIAVIDHVANWVIHQDWLELGFASDTSLESFGELSTVGYPGLKPNCDGNSGSAGFLDSEGQLSAYLYRQVAGIQDTPGQRLQMYADGGKGQSGSPYFYCIGGCYDDADTGLLAGVWSTWNPATTNRTACKTNEKNIWLLGEL